MIKNFTKVLQRSFLLQKAYLAAQILYIFNTSRYAVT